MRDQSVIPDDGPGAGSDAQTAPAILHELAREYAIDVDFRDWQGEHRTVADDTLHAVLAAFDVDTSSPQACRDALARRRAQAASGELPAHRVLAAGTATELASDIPLELHHEDGTTAILDPVDGRLGVPALPAGYHHLQGRTRCLLIVVPARVPLPDRLQQGPAWGLAAQLYSVRSRDSWGIGDLHDLGELAGWAAREHGADYVLINPLHAAEPVAPMENSPYLPTTRRYANPLYLRVEDVPEFRALPAPAAEQIATWAVAARRANTDLLDRDATWAAKRAALEQLYAVRRSAEREHAFADFVEREGATLRDFATWCAIAEVHGVQRDAWPAELHDPRDQAVARFAAEYQALVLLHCWLQWLLDEQLAATQRTAREAGMALGVIHDVAVGVSPDGADAWSWQGELATSVTVGAPPDAYSQTGQDWNQPPWRPDRLSELGYAPFRDLFATALRHCGGLRVDHVIGLFRLWWIPRGAPAGAGTYVHYDHDALIGILMIEATRAGAVLVGEDLGNVEPWVRDYLSERGVFGTSILWFEYDGAAALPPERWRELCLASVTTHDLPPTAGYLAGDHIRLRDRLGLLTRGLDEELALARSEQQAWLDVLHDRGLLAAGAPDAAPDPAAVTTALHRAVRGAPSLLRCAALTDAVGDRRTQNQPGTGQQQYANWRQPLRDRDGVPVYLEDVVTDPGAAALLATLHD